MRLGAGKGGGGGEECVEGGNKGVHCEMAKVSEGRAGERMGPWGGKRCIEHSGEDEHPVQETMPDGGQDCACRICTLHDHPSLEAFHTATRSDKPLHRPLTQRIPSNNDSPNLLFMT